MLKFQPKQTRKIWQPLNRKSQLVAAIAVLAIAMVQAYFWTARWMQTQPSQTQTAQQSPKK
jgi:uncharacterized protein (DUF2062 family)